MALIRVFRQVLLTVALLLYGYISFAQQLPVTRYTIREGLVQMQCTALFKDSRGYIWVGTKHGLSKFDGERFENFGRKEGLLSEYINGIIEDPRGRIWLNTRLGLVCFDGKAFSSFPIADTLESITGIQLTERGEPLISVSDGKRNIPLQLYNGQFLPFRSPLPTLTDKSNGFLYYDTSNKRMLLSIEQEKPRPAQLWWNEGRRLTQFRGNNSPYCLWSMTGKLANGKPVFMAHHPQRLNERTYFYLSDNELVPIFRSTPQSFTILNKVPSAAVVRTESRHFLLEPGKNQPIPLPIPKTQLWAYTFDKEGIWCATEKGLFRVWNNGFRYFSEQEVPNCWSVVEDRSQRMWFLNYQSPLLQFDGNRLIPVKGAAFQSFRAKYPGLIDNWYYHAIRDQHGNLWLPNIEGAVRFDGKTYSLHTDPGQVETLCLFEDKERNLILKGGLKQVLFIENQPPYRFTRFDESNGFKDPNGFVLSMAKDSRGNYWFGGRNLTRYDYTQQKVTYYTTENGRFPAKVAYSMAVDNRRNLWVGTAKGLLRYDLTADYFRNVLPDSLVSQVMMVGQLDNTHLLFGGAKNLYVLDLDNYYRTGQASCKIFNHNNGFPGLELGQDGFYKDSKGYIWLTSGTVLTRLDPHLLNLQPSPLRTFISKVNQERIPFVGKPPVVELPYGQNIVSFTLETLGADKPFATQYSYQVEGVLNDWSPWQAQNLITLTNLENGTFRLRVRSRSGNLQYESPAEAMIQFRVSLPFWRSPGFYRYAFFIGLCLMISLGYFWWRQQQQRRRIEEQENKVRFLQVQTIQAQMNPHFTFNVLGTIQHLILANDTQRASENLIKLSHLIRNYLEASLLGDERNGSLFNHEIPLAREVELLQMYVDFEKLQYEDRFTFEMSVDGEINPENYRIPPLILQPFVENAIKHGLLYKEEFGHLWIRFVKHDEETLICIIEDDGAGRRLARKIQLQSLRKYQSRGTDLVKRRIEILNRMGYDIRLSTSDRPGGGTVVRIQIGYQ